MDDERFLNSYHNASSAPGPDVPSDLAGFMSAADPVLAQAAELARVLARAHQGAAAQLFGEGWAHARKYFSLSEKYATGPTTGSRREDPGSMPAHTRSIGRSGSPTRNSERIPNGEASV